MNFSKTWTLPLVLLFLTGFTAAIYFPGLSGPFTFDDYNNIVDNKALQFEGAFVDSLKRALFAGQAGPLKRPLSMLSFAINRELTGLEPFYFKLTNLAIHLLNGCLVYLLACRLLILFAKFDAKRPINIRAVACVTAGIWLVHPAQLTSVLYVVQRMTSLSATFLFAGLLLYLRVREQLLYDRPAMKGLWLGVPLLAGLSCMAKENGALLFVFALAIELSMLNFRTYGARRDCTLRLYFVIFVGLPLAAAVIFLILNPGWLTDPHMTRPFNVIERLMSEARALILYLKILFVPSISSLALYYDDFQISRGLLSPAATLPAILSLALLLVVALVRRRRWPLLSFAVLWFFAGHLLESTIVMLELVHVHRNYVAYFGPILALVYGGAQLLRRKPAVLLQSVAAVVIGVLGMATAQRAQQWGHPFEQAAFEVHHRPGSPRANYELGRLYFLAADAKHDEALRLKARHYLEQAMLLDPRAVNAPVALMIVDGGAHAEESTSARLALQQRLAARPLSTTEIHFIRSLIDCQEKAGCRRPAQHILDVFGSALSHPLLRKPVKADLLVILGMYYANSLGDLPGCIRLMREAIALVPADPNHRLNLVGAYLADNQLTMAESMLEEAEHLDLLGIFSSRIKDLRGELEKRTQAGRTN